MACVVIWEWRQVSGVWTSPERLAPALLSSILAEATVPSIACIFPPNMPRWRCDAQGCWAAQSSAGEHGRRHQLRPFRSISSPGPAHVDHHGRPACLGPLLVVAGQCYPARDPSVVGRDDAGYTIASLGVHPPQAQSNPRSGFIPCCPDCVLVPGAQGIVASTKELDCADEPTPDSSRWL